MFANAKLAGILNISVSCRFKTAKPGDLLQEDSLGLYNIAMSFNPIAIE